MNHKLIFSRSTIGRALFSCIPPFCLAGLAFGQQASLLDSAVTPSGRLFSDVGVVPQAVVIRSALSGIFDQPGHERHSLQGAITQNGNLTPFQFVRELDQSARLDLGVAVPRSFVVSGLNTIKGSQVASKGANPDGGDTDIFEVLAEDSPEAFLFDFGSTQQVRWVGAAFRADDGSNPNYSGPRYDVYFVNGSSATQPNSPSRSKAFLFDSKSKLLAFTRYQVDRGNGPVQVEVAYTNWNSMSGAMTPATITRSEDGKVVFAIAVTSSVCSGTKKDGLFGN